IAEIIGATMTATATEGLTLAPLAIGSLGVALLLTHPGAASWLRSLSAPFEVVALLLAVVGVLASSAARNPPFGATLAAVVGPTSLPASVAIALCALAL